MQNFKDMKASPFHSLRRTSPKGEKFVGVCTQCGTADLTLANMNDNCHNQRGLTQEQSLVEAIQPVTH